MVFVLVSQGTLPAVLLFVGSRVCGRRGCGGWTGQAVSHCWSRWIPLHRLAARWSSSVPRPLSPMSSWLQSRSVFESVRVLAAAGSGRAGGAAGVPAGGRRAGVVRGGAVLRRAVAVRSQRSQGGALRARGGRSGRGHHAGRFTDRPSRREGLPPPPPAVRGAGDRRPVRRVRAGSTNHPLRPFFRWWFWAASWAQCRHAAAASYVTRARCRSGYPCPGYTAAFSDVQIPEAAVVAARAAAGGGEGSVLTLAAVGSLENPTRRWTCRSTRGGVRARRAERPGWSWWAAGGCAASWSGAAGGGGGGRVEFRGLLPAGPAVRAVLDGRTCSSCRRGPRGCRGR